jgi:hypothetical protein
VLDIAWHQNGKRDSGQFVVHLVKAKDWENPLSKSVAISLGGLKRVVKKTVALVERIEN